MLKTEFAPAGSTGNATFPASGGIEIDSPNQGGGSAAIAFEFIVEAVGATPTVTFKWQGSVDGVNFFDVAYITDATDVLAVAALTKTAVGATIVFLANPAARAFKIFRLVVSANTNVTYRAEAYAPD